MREIVAIVCVSSGEHDVIVTCSYVCSVLDGGADYSNDGNKRKGN